MNRIDLVLFFFVFFIFSFESAHSQRNDVRLDLTPVAELQKFDWIEMQHNGEPYVDESGFRYSIGLQSKIFLLQQQKLSFETNLRYTLGTVDYDGYLFDSGGSQRPYQTSTGYTGYDGTVQAGYVFKLHETFGVRPMTGAGLERWQRNLDKGGSFGYSEHYRSIFVHVGLRKEYSPAPALEIHMSGVIKKPVSASLTVPLLAHDGADVTEADLKLPNNSSYLFTAGLNVKRVSLNLYYDFWNVGESSVDFGYYLPNSDRKLTGLRVGYSIPVYR